MLHIFLVILKIIGILLAAVLGILLFFILCLLFWPVRYHIAGQKKEEWEIRGRIRFMGPLVRLSVWYEKEIGYKLQILGIRVLPGRKKKKTGKKNKRQKTYTKKSEKKQVLEEEEEWNAPLPEVPKEEKDTAEGVLESFWNKIRTKSRSVMNAVRNLCRYLKRLKELYEDAGVRAGFAHLKAELWILLKRIKPKKMHWYLKIGFEDPANTGQLLGALAVLSGFWGQDIQAEPDFEHKVFETDFSARGCIRGSYLLRIVWKCLFDKEIKYLLDKVKN